MDIFEFLSSVSELKPWQRVIDLTGYVDTDMTSHKGTKTVEDGADTLSWLALLPPNDPANPVAQFVAERKALDWRPGMTREQAFSSTK